MKGLLHSTRKKQGCNAVVVGVNDYNDDDNVIVDNDIDTDDDYSLTYICIICWIYSCFLLNEIAE